MTTRRREGVTTGRPLGAPSTVADPIARLLAAFLDGRSPHTQDAYTRDLDGFCAFLRRHTLRDPNPIGHSAQQTAVLRWFFDQPQGRANECVFNYRNELTTRCKATGTVSRHLATIKSLAKYARMIGLVSWSIEVQAPRVERSRDTRGPSLEVVQRMLTTASRQPAPVGPRNVALLRLAFDLALRIGELARLDVGDVDLEHSTLWILGKGRRAKELLTMPDTSRDAVRTWLDVRGTEPGPLLTSFSPAKQHHGRLVTRGIYRIVRDLGAAVGAHVRPHGLRHTSITQAIDAAARKGLSIDVVRQFSRHKAIGTLLIYRDLHENKQGTIAGWVSEQLPARRSGA